MVEFPTITDKHFPLILDRAELEEDDLIDDQWHVLDRIGCGGYSNVYLVNLYAGTKVIRPAHGVPPHTPLRSHTLCALWRTTATTEWPLKSAL
ncbi:hypothetical protein L596_025694 [Steinernema carpocapsae]|uniref:Protein kinase domain-containing protein n=1 Tax=Steinernema carpocapsae TaxID=34508 RepID=A0A4U5M8H9_STECR|nr:hypothetical protein L596_025694 [Steinernema carpocapsae]